ncbi:hypothetical protein GCM10010357_51060 [Streptomyces luteireticuli]|uniref:Uncharacterized protein n=1 Tax=Streptomyces luteireticuli TaxID=173858 RepID=A0ABP3IST2_9ACTN
MGGEGDLVDPVGALGEQAHGQQAAEIAQLEQDAKITHDGHAVSFTYGTGPRASRA